MMAAAQTQAWNDIPAVHWQGGALDCSGCTHAPLRAAGGCEPGRMCMQDAYARRIDRFVRATVARRLPEALLPLLVNDPDLMVRREVARRVQMPALWRMVEDPEADVRRIVAERLPPPLLDSFIADPDLLVRWEAAGRALGHALLHFAGDAQAEIRERAQARLETLEPEHG